MIGLICFLFFAILAIRSLILAVSERKPAMIRVLDLLFTLVFAAAAVALLVFTGLKFSAASMVKITLIFAALTVPTLLLLMFRVRRPYRRRPTMFLLKMIGVLLIFCVGMLAVMMTGFLNLTEDQPILKVTMTGKYQEVPVEWKPPSGSLRRENLKAYEVVLARPDNHIVSRIHIYGDQVAVKARLLRFQPILNAIGIQNLYKIDYVHNGYTTAQRFNKYPHHAQEITSAHPLIAPLQDPFWNYWENFYRGRSKTPLVKSATMESNYFPLVYANGSPFRGSYFLTITPGGLSSVPLP